jgi:hypothetical protein
MEAGVDGLLRDKTRPPGKPPVADARVGAVVAMTLKPPTGEATHWTARAMAGITGLAVSTVQKIWKSHGLAPHRWRSFKLSNDPAFVEKLRDVIGLYVAPPAHAGECLKLCVSDRVHAVFRYVQASKRPVNIMAS